jgi:hypothetical protein
VVSGDGSVVGGVVSLVVPEVDGEAYEVRRSSRKICAWSLVSVMASYCGCERMEGL